MLLCLIDERRELSESELADAFADQTPSAFRDEVNTAVRGAVLRHPPEAVVGVDWGPANPGVASAMISLASGDRLALATRDTRIGPASVTFTIFERISADIEVRGVVPSDGPALRRLERRTPLVLGDAEIRYDKGEDYFVGDELMGETDSRVITIRGEPLGLFTSLERRTLVAGKPRVLAYNHRLRIAPEAQGRRLSRIIQYYSMAYGSPEAETAYGFIAAANETMIRNSPPGQLWSVAPERVVISTGVAAGLDDGRVATADDEPFLVELLNDTHESEELFVPYTTDSLAERLSRVPTAYSWGNFRLNERAVVGVWNADWAVKRTVDEVETETRRALVLDYGLEKGADDAFVRLLRAAAADLSSQGITELTVFTAPGVRGRSALHQLAERVEPYRLRVDIPEPADTADRGVHVDQLYF